MSETIRCIKTLRESRKKFLKNITYRAWIEDRDGKLYITVNDSANRKIMIFSPNKQKQFRKFVHEYFDINSAPTVKKIVNGEI